MPESADTDFPAPLHAVSRFAWHTAADWGSGCAAPLTVTFDWIVTDNSWECPRKKIHTDAAQGG